MSLLTRTRQAIKATLGFCFPGLCAACNEPCEGAASLCPACSSTLDTLVTSPLCDRCSFPLGYHRAPCPRCSGKGVRPFDYLIAMGLYEPPLSSLVIAVKYRKAWEWATALTDRLIATGRLDPLKRDGALLVPVPLHPLRHFTRGYNQAELIAAHLSKNLKIQSGKPLLRIRQTPSQTIVQSRAKRLENLKGAFALETARSVRNRHVILVDDVTTTGATLRAAATALRVGRPRSISACVLAIADPKGRSFEQI